MKQGGSLTEQPAASASNAHSDTSVSMSKSTAPAALTTTHSRNTKGSSEHPVAAAVSSADASPRAVKVHAGLAFAKEEDIGRTIEMFSFRLNDWETLKIIDFEPNGMQHKCQWPSGASGKGISQWLDLRKKSIR